MTKIGYCITASHCTFQKTIEILENLVKLDYEITPILSYNAGSVDTRFYKAKDFVEDVEKITKRKAILTIADAEPLGTKLRQDLMIVAPCTGNTLGKLSHGITDTPVTMAVKAHHRNNSPVLIGVSSNDALGVNAENIGKLLNTKNIFFVPMVADDCVNKPKSLVADFSKIDEAIEYALKYQQIMPIFC